MSVVRTGMRLGARRVRRSSQGGPPAGGSLWYALPLFSTFAWETWASSSGSKSKGAQRDYGKGVVEKSILLRGHLVAGGGMRLSCGGGGESWGRGTPISKYLS